MIIITTLFRWIINVTNAIKFIFNKSMLNTLNMFPTKEQQVVYPIVARLGIFVYSTLVPLLMIWRQKPYRDEFVSMFQDAKTRVTDFTTSIFN